MVSTDFVPLKDDNPDEAALRAALRRVVKKALMILKKDKQTHDRLLGWGIRHLVWGEITHDIETSRHMSDDRDVYVVEIHEKADGIFTVDYVHEPDGTDRRGHTVFFQIDYNGHQMAGSVSLPFVHDEECYKAFVSLESHFNI
jgi:hypothetical protein